MVSTATKSLNQLKSSNLVTMATTTKVYKSSFFYTYKDGGNNNNTLGKLSRTTVVPTTINLFFIFLNLVTMATTNILY